MKLQSASRKEIRRIAIGSFIGLGLMIAVFFVLSLLGIGKMDYRIFLSGIVGTVVAVLNFTVLCLTIQKAAQIEDQKQMKARFQLSYNARLILQAAWVVVAFLLPCFHVIAAAVPLLFPTLTIYYLQFRGVLVTPSTRKNPPAEDLPEEDDRQDTFEA